MKTRSSDLPEPVPQLRDLQPYFAEETCREVVLKLDANEGPAQFDFEGILGDNVPLNRYPSSHNLEQAIADWHSIERSQVLVTAGGDESIDRIFRAYLQPGQNLITTRPTFAMIDKYAVMAGAECRTIDWLDNDFPEAELIELANEQTRIIAIVSPNNPTGQVISLDNLKQVANTFPDRLLLVDQAYAEFEKEPGELTRFAINHIPNAVVIRSFSKAWGLAGIRVGYAIGSTEVIDNLRKVGGPYTVPRPSLAIAQTALRNYPERTIRKIQSERSELTKLLDECGCKTIHSQGNFVLALFDQQPFNSKFVFQALSAQGILVRQFTDLNALRITCPGDDNSFKKLCRNLRCILRPEGLLFDMDGVLVDEGPSYREAIRQTCEFFGESFSADEIAELKLSGDGNNDWIFTQRILQSRGATVDFEEVKTRFELIYQGGEGYPGLWDREIQLVQTQWLELLSLRFPLAIVTGRPRHDAIRFLRNAGIEKLFSSIVCMEDGPRKPNPANVQTAMRQLEINSAWMIGDTPDDINAARSAGIPAIGIPAPADNPETTKQLLLNAGACSIVANLQQFGDLLP